MSNYTKSTNFATKDNLTPGDPLKVVRGTEIDTEFNNIATAVATKTDNASAAITGGAIDGATVGATTPATGSFTTLAASGTTTLAGALVGAVTQAAFNTTTTTLNLGGAATAVNLGAATGTATVNNTTLAAKAITASTTLAVTGTSTLTGAVTATAGVSGPITSSSVSITGGSITGITDLAVADGGTGASTAAGGLNNLLPSQTGNANKYLQTDGTNASWDAVTLSTADITGTLPVANGGTGITSFGSGIATFLGTPSSANLASAVTDETGSGALVFANSPTLVTPALGTPSALVGTNITGTASGLTAGNVTTNANLTGAVTSVGNATSLGSFSSANLLGALTDETGTGSAVFATSPTLVTPILGTPTSATLTNATGLPISTGVSGLGTGVATFLATPSSANLAAALTDETGTGSAVFATSPTLVTPVLGTPTSATLTNATGLPLTTGVTGTLPTANGGTNLTSFTSGGVVYASSTSALATGSALTFDGTTPTSSNAIGSPNFIFNSSANTPYIRFDQSGSAKLTIGASAIVASGAGYDFYGTAGIGFTFFTNASRRLDITSAGDVGIGTSSPSVKLNVVSTSGGSVVDTLRLSNNASDAGTGSRISFHTADAVFNAIDGVRVGGGSGGRLAFSTMGTGGSLTERVRISEDGTLRTFSTISVGNVAPSSSGAGITFPATQSASSDANTLDDYEEGTWSVQLQDGSNNNATMEAGFTTATYVKIGRQVTVTGIIYTSSVAGLSGGIRVSGLPFAVGTGNQFRGAGATSSEQLLNITSGQKLSLLIYSGLSTKFEIYISNSTAGGNQMTAAEWSNDGLAQFSLTYFTD